MCANLELVNGTEGAKLCKTEITKLMKESGNEELINDEARVDEAVWFALYTRSRAEKRAMDWLLEDGFEVYLPLKRELKQWSDRKKWIESPLIPSYIFVKVTRKQYYKVLDCPYLVRYITFEGKPTPIREREVEVMKLLLEEASDQTVLVTANIKKGDKVEITGGPMQGAVGEVVFQRGKYKFQIRPENLGFALQVEVNAVYLKKILKK